MDVNTVVDKDRDVILKVFSLMIYAEDAKFKLALSQIAFVRRATSINFPHSMSFPRSIQISVTRLTSPVSTYFSRTCTRVTPP